MKTVVNLRVKKLVNGNGSYYLDWFQNGKRNYEYLKLYTVLSDRLTKEERDANRESLKLAQQIRNMRENQLIAEPEGITPTAKRKQSAISYFENNAISKGSQLMVNHLKTYLQNRNIQIQSINKDLIQGFPIIFPTSYMEIPKCLLLKISYNSKESNSRKVAPFRHSVGRIRPSKKR